jgi:hypothetical protein
MGQAAATLPEPATLSDAPGAASAQATASADDLLSKLAGDEVDKLLAEAEEPARPATAPPMPAAPQSAFVTLAPASDAAATSTITGESGGPAAEQVIASPAESEPPSASPQDTMTPVTPEPAPTPSVHAPTAVDAAPAPSPPGAMEESAVKGELDTLFNELTAAQTQAADVEAPPVDPPVESPDASAPVDPKLSELEAELHKSLTAAVPEASLAPAPTAASAVGPKAPDVKSATPAPADESQQGTRWWLLPLEWLNYPLTAASPELRQTIGKVAIITAFNALVVLAYVAFFRG